MEGSVRSPSPPRSKTFVCMSSNQSPLSCFYFCPCSSRQGRGALTDASICIRRRLCAK